MITTAAPPFFLPADLERRFGALDRLYGPGAAARLRAARLAVVGLGGVGSWSAEVLARCGVGQLVLIDLDQIAESNVNRQIHALSQTLGQSKVAAMAARVAGINPACQVQAIDDFVTPENVGTLLPAELDVILDCTDQISAKVAMVRLARARGQSLVVCGAAGGKTDPLALRAGDLAHASHDALLARLRQVLRKQHGYPAGAPPSAKRPPAQMGVQVLWVAQQAVLPVAWQSSAGQSPAQQNPSTEPAACAPQGLSCAGYGSVVMVTAAMGMAAAHQAVQQIWAQS